MAKKSDKAIEKADPRGYADELAKIAKGEQGDSALPTFPIAGKSTIAKLFATYDMEPPIAPIPEGAMIKGKLIGPGAPVDTTDPETGEPRPLGTWVVEIDGGIRFRIVSSHQLDSFFGPTKSGAPSKYVGKEIVLVKGGKTDTGKGGRTVREWLVGTPKE